MKKINPKKYEKTLKITRITHIRILNIFFYFKIAKGIQEKKTKRNVKEPLCSKRTWYIVKKIYLKISNAEIHDLRNSDNIKKTGHTTLIMCVVCYIRQNDNTKFVCLKKKSLIVKNMCKKTYYA